MVSVFGWPDTGPLLGMCNWGGGHTFQGTWRVSSRQVCITACNYQHIARYMHDK
jgi:hypothetical protein